MRLDHVLHECSKSLFTHYSILKIHEHRSPHPLNPNPTVVNVSVFKYICTLYLYVYV